MHSIVVITAIYILCARPSPFTNLCNIAYSTLRSISFWISGRSFLCDLWSNSLTLRHKNYIYIYKGYTKIILKRVLCSYLDRSTCFSENPNLSPPSKFCDNTDLNVTTRHFVTTLILSPPVLWQHWFCHHPYFVNTDFLTTRILCQHWFCYHPYFVTTLILSPPVFCDNTDFVTTRILWQHWFCHHPYFVTTIDFVTTRILW